MDKTFTKRSMFCRLFTRSKGRKLGGIVLLAGLLFGAAPAMAQESSSKVTLSETSVTLGYEKQYTKLTLVVDSTVGEMNAFVWESEDPEVAVVNSQGVVRALKSGTTTIKGYNDDYSVECQVTVSNGFQSLLPTDDAYVQGGASTTNYGDNPRLLVKYDTYLSTHRRSFIKFDISSLDVSKKLKVQLVINQMSANTESGTVNTEIHAVDDTTANGNWSESTLTWANQPTYSSTVLASMAAHYPFDESNAANNVLAFDITDYVKQQLAAGKTVADFVIVQSARGKSGKNDFWMGAKENETELLRPALAVQDNTITGYRGITTSNPILDKDNMYTQMEVEIEPASAASDIVWSSSNDSIVVVSPSGAVMAKAPGVAYVRALLSNGSVDSTSVTVSDDVVRYNILDDAFIQDGTSNQDTNFGSRATMIVKKDGVGYDRKAFVKFPLPSLSTLNMKNSKPHIELVFTTTQTNTTASETQVAAYPAGDFDELTLTSATAPTVDTAYIALVNGPKTITSQTTITDRLLRFDVSDYAQTLYAKGQDYISLMIYQPVKGSGKHDFQLATKENGNAMYHPYMLVSAIDTTRIEGLSESVVELDIEKPYTQIIANTVPEGASVTWSISQPQVALIDNSGRILAKETGKAMVYATLANGQTDSCLVTVEQDLYSVDPMDDAWIFGGTHSDENKAGATTLTIKNEANESYARKALMKIAVPGISSTYFKNKKMRAVLLMNATFVNTVDSVSNTDINITVQPLQSNDWNSSTVTWNTTPQIDSTVVGTAPRPAYKNKDILKNYIAIDITDYVTSLYDNMNGNPGGMSLAIYQDRPASNGKHDIQVASVRNSNEMLRPRLYLLPEELNIEAYVPAKKIDFNTNFGEGGNDGKYDIPQTGSTYMNANHSYRLYNNAPGGVVGKIVNPLPEGAAYVTYRVASDTAISYKVYSLSSTADSVYTTVGGTWIGNKVAIPSTWTELGIGTREKSRLYLDDVTIYVAADSTALKTASTILVNGKLGVKETKLLSKLLEQNTQVTSVDLNDATTTSKELLLAGNPNCVFYDNQGTFNLPTQNTVRNGKTDFYYVDAYGENPYGALYPFTAKSIQYNRTFDTQSPNLVVLPFSVDTTMITAKLYGSLTFNADSAKIYAEEVGSVHAGVPVFIATTEVENPFGRALLNVNARIFASSAVLDFTNGGTEEFILDGLEYDTLITNADTEAKYTNYVYESDGTNGKFVKVLEKERLSAGTAYLCYAGSGNTESYENIPVIFKSNGETVNIKKTIIESNTPVNVYTLEGVLVKKNVPFGSALNGLQKGIYIVGGKKMIVL